MPIIGRMAALAAALVLLVPPVAAATIGQDVKITRAEIVEGQVRVDGKGRSQHFYRLVSSTGVVLGLPYKSKPAGYFWISGGSVHPGSCTVQLQTSPTNTATSKWKVVTGGVLLGNCHPAGATANVYKVQKVCQTAFPESWLYLADNVFGPNSDGYYCLAACDIGDEPVLATLGVHLNYGDGEDDQAHQEPTTLSVLYEGARNLGIDSQQYVAYERKGDISDSYNNRYTVTAWCAKP